jgi:sugar phosphate isomerase/epimerase
VAPMTAEDTHPRLCVSGVCTFAWSLADTVAFWHRAGIRRVGLPLPPLRDAGLDDAVALLLAADLDVLDVIDLSPFRLGDPGGWSSAGETAQELIDVAARLGSPSVMMSTGGALGLPWDEAAAAFDAAYGPLATSARQRGMRLSFENSSPLRPEYGFASTLRDTAELAQSVGGGLCVEISNCWGERGLERTVAQYVDLIDVVQLSDYVLGTGRTPDRAVPGDGSIPLDRMVSLFEAAGYQGPYELEMIGPRIDEEGPDVAVVRGLRTLTELFDRIGVAGR